MKFRKKPVVIEAMQWDGENTQDVAYWASDKSLKPYELPKGWWLRKPDGKPFTLVIPTLEGDHDARIGDWIIRGVNGEFYPCKPDIFQKTYEAAE